MFRQHHTVGAMLGGAVLLLGVSLAILGMLLSSGTLANPKLGHSDETAEGLSSEQTAEPGKLPKHPFEEMGVAGLSPSAGMADNAISDAQAIDIVTESTWGPHWDELVKSYPASAIPAVYNAQASAMGPAADERPVWVVILAGWAPAGRCGPGDWGPPGPEGPSSQPSSQPGSGGEPVSATVNAGYSIVDAVTGQMLGSWHYTKCG